MEYNKKMFTQFRIDIYFNKLFLYVKTRPVVALQTPHPRHTIHLLGKLTPLTYLTPPGRILCTVLVTIQLFQKRPLIACNAMG